MADGELIIKWIGGAIDVYSDPAGGRYPPPKSEIEKALDKMHLVLDEAGQSAESASVSAQNARNSEKNAQKHTENARMSAENARASELKAEQIAKAIEGEAQKVADTARAGIEAIDSAGKEAIFAIQSVGGGEVNKVTAAGSAEVQRVATEGDKQVQAATEQANLAKQSADSVASKVQEVAESVTAGKQEIATEKDVALSAVQGEGSKQVQAVNDAGKAQISAVQGEGTKQSKAVGAEGAKQLSAVQAEGTKQGKAIADAGAAQVAAVQTEGTKKVDEIKAIESLLPAPSAQDAGKVPMVNPAGTGYTLGEVAVDAYIKAESDKRYMPLAAGIKPIKSGELITLTDSAEFGLQGLKVYGKSTQDGVPTPEAPVPIVSVGDGGSITITLTDTAKQEQKFLIPTPNGLPGIPVRRGGNYNDSKGQQWTCDEIDFSRGKYIQRIKKIKLSDLNWKMIITQKHKNYNFKGALDAYTSVSYVAPAIFTILPYKDVVWEGEPSTLPKAYCWDLDAVLSFPPDSPINSLEVFHDLISRTSAEAAYILATPIEHDLSPELIADYQKLHTYYPITNLFASDSAGLEVQYLADTKNYLDSKLKTLVAQYHANQAAVLSLMPLETQATMIQNDTDNILSQEGI